MQNKIKLNTVLLVIIIILLVIGLVYVFLGNSKKKEDNNLQQNITVQDEPTGQAEINNSSTYTYKNHGFTIELPKGYIPHEEQSEGGPATIITLPNSNRLNYVSDASFWEEFNIPQYQFIKNEKIGETLFKVYTSSGITIYYFKQGNVAYEYVGDKNLLSTFRFVGWAQN
jgi:hypothetical protein